MLRIGSLAVLLVSASALADITLISDKDAFMATTQNQVADLFEDMSCDDTTASPMSRAVGAYSYSGLADGDFYNSCVEPGTSLSTNLAEAPVVLDTFTGGVSAIGADFFTTNIQGEPQAGQMEITVTDSTGAMASTVLDTPDLTFAGFVSTGEITSFTMQAVQPDQAYHWPAANSLVLAGSQR